MTDTHNTTETTENIELLTEIGAIDGLASFDSATQIVSTAVGNALAAAELTPIGDHGAACIVPDGMKHTILDLSDWENVPRSRGGTFRFVDPDSLIGYVDRYITDDTLLYGTDPHGRGTKLLTQSTNLLGAVLDDHPIDGAANRNHNAALMMRPTEEARRWGHALGNKLDQEMFLDLIVDGMGEIADPPGGDLRDLVSDLHAIRTSEVESIVRTGGEGSIKVSDNVKLHAGQGTEVSFPEEMSVTFAPFVDVEDVVGLTLRIKPKVVGSNVVFTLTCAGLDNALATIAHRVANAVGVQLDREVMWTAP
jgi:hypothetical protein